MSDKKDYLLGLGGDGPPVPLPETGPGPASPIPGRATSQGEAAQPPSDEAKLAFVKAHTAVEGEWLPSDKWEEALDAGLRAAYAVQPLYTAPVEQPKKLDAVRREIWAVLVKWNCGEPGNMRWEGLMRDLTRAALQEEGKT